MKTAMLITGIFLIVISQLTYDSGMRQISLGNRWLSVWAINHPMKKGIGINFFSKNEFNDISNGYAYYFGPSEVIVFVTTEPWTQADKGLPNSDQRKDR